VSSEEEDDQKFATDLTGLVRKQRKAEQAKTPGASPKGEGGEEGLPDEKRAREEEEDDDDAADVY
jgi:hypothetical protein